MIAVADSGPLMALAKIGGLPALFALYPQVFTSPAVREEVVTAGLRLGLEDARLLDEAYQQGYLQVRAPALATLPLPALLGPGEDEAIRLAIELRADWLLMDDFDARQAAEANIARAGVPTGVRGTLGVIVSAHQEHILTRDEALALVEAIPRRPDIWISTDLCQRVIDALKASA
jgi:predicted nucleic acid-binding protein